MTYICDSETGSSLVQAMALCLFGARPFPESIPVYFKLDL